MKTNRWLLAACTLLAMLWCTAWGDEDKIAYLGVATAPVEPAVAAQVGLPEGVGVLVVNVAEDGVVKGKLAPYDILHKLDDHLLTSPAQFVELVRDHKPGDEIKLLILHKGKPETLKIRLGSIEPDKLAERAPRRLFTPPSPFRPQLPGGTMNDDFSNALRDLRRRMEQLERQWRDRLPPAEEDHSEPPTAEPEEHDIVPTPPVPFVPHSQHQQHTESTSVVTDMRDGLTVTLTDHNGQRTVKAEEKGQVIFEGPVNTEKQMHALPAKVRQRVKEMDQNFKIQIQQPGSGAVSGVPL